MNPFGRMAAAATGALVEAWSEVRVHRGRVLLSLIGVGVAVTALTVVVAAGGIAEQSFRESGERQSGRAATLNIQAYTEDGGAFDVEQFEEAVRGAADRYDIEYLSEHGYADLDVRFADGTSNVSVQTVDQPFAVMHRLDLMSGSWFTASDETRLAPSLVVNQRFWERLGSPDLRTHPTVVLPGNLDTLAVVVGVTPSPTYDTSFSMYMLASQARQVTSPAEAGAYGPPQYEAWVPEGVAEDLRTRLVDDIGTQMGESVTVDAFRADYAEQQAESLAQIQLIVGGIALLVLLLGALGLVNIALVTVRARIREIGIRRTFGATASRVFFAVMMESVAATVVAGVAGVMLAVLLVKNPITEEFIGQGVSDIPPFPVEAAIVGLVAATAVGALAGLLPALVAVRVKVIDAIRY